MATALLINNFDGYFFQLQYLISNASDAWNALTWRWFSWYWILYTFFMKYIDFHSIVGGFAIYRHLYFSRDIENIRWIYHVLFSHFLCFASHSCIRFQINWLVLKLIALQLRDYGVFSSKKYNSFHSHANVEFLSKSENYWIFHWNMMSLESNFS